MIYYSKTSASYHLKTQFVQFITEFLEPIWIAIVRLIFIVFPKKKIVTYNIINILLQPNFTYGNRKQLLMLVKKLAHFDKTIFIISIMFTSYCIVLVLKKERAFVIQYKRLLLIQVPVNHARHWRIKLKIFTQKILRKV